MTRAFSRHLRGALPAYGTKDHFDWSANGDSLRELEPVLPPAEHIQTDPVTVMKSIERAEIIWAFTIVAACVVIAGALNIIGGNA